MNLYGSVFISYSRSDKEHARRLRIELERRHCSVWMDDSQLQIGSRLTPEITTAIRETDYFLVLLSPRSSKSAWVIKEVELALLVEESRNENFIFPVNIMVNEGINIISDHVALDLHEGGDFDESLNHLLRCIRKLQYRGPLKASANEIIQSVSASYPQVASLVEEAKVIGGLKEAGLMNCIRSACPAEDIGAALEALAEWALENDPNSEKLVRVGCATGLASLFFERDLDTAFLERLLDSEALDDNDISTTAAYFSRELEQEQLDKIVHLFTTHFREDSIFNSILEKNRNKLRASLEGISRYLLYPDRGPGDYNIDSYLLVLSEHPDRAELIGRVDHWLSSGKLAVDDDKKLGHVDIFFKFLLKYYPAWNTAFEKLGSRASDKIYGTLKSVNSSSFAHGFLLLNGLERAARRSVNGSNEYSRSIGRMCEDRVYRETIPNELELGFSLLLRSITHSADITLAEQGILNESVKIAISMMSDKR